MSARIFRLIKNTPVESLQQNFETVYNELRAAIWIGVFPGWGFQSTINLGSRSKPAIPVLI